MVRVTEGMALSQDQVRLYYTTDTLLANLPVLVFHGHSTTSNSTLNSSRIQVHIFTAAGFQTYPRITISPSSPFYQSVNHLPREQQGDEVTRGIAFGLLRYFTDISEVAKSALILQCAASRSKQRPGSAPSLFSEQHAASLASSMVEVENVEEVIQDIQAALRTQHINHIDVDLVLPPGSVSDFRELAEDEATEDELMDPISNQYGAYAPLVRLFGEVSFLPTSKLRRAPSKPTSLNRSKSFLKDHKMSLRREMGELVDTEERYVIKMHELVNQIADEYRSKAKQRTVGSSSPSEDDLAKLFPKCVDRILQVNTAFLAEIKKVMDETEEEAMLDLESPTVSVGGSRHGGAGRPKDPTGALAFAKVLLEWFPQFQECYQQYIIASQNFPKIITSFLGQQSSFSQRVQQTGEQKLRSAIIEPVQRLPRYSLFIDNIVKFLPLSHPALQPMLKARDIITSICSMDPPATDSSQLLHRLNKLVELWPSSLKPQGRLITAIDFSELAPPYHPKAPSSQASAREGMLLLFADCVVFLRKTRENSLSAKALLSEVEHPSATVMMASMTAAAGGQKHVYELAFSGWHVLGDTRFTMSEDGGSIWMSSSNKLRDAHAGRDRNQPPTVRSFVLQGTYAGKALKLTEEITKARLEGRFPESERETDKWSYRSTRLAAAGITLHTAIFVEGVDTLIPGRREPAPIRIVVDHEKGTKGAPVGHYGVDLVANLTSLVGGLTYRLEVSGLNGKTFTDEVVTEHVLPTFIKRVVDLLCTYQTVSNPSLTAPLISFHSKILKSLHVELEDDKPKTPAFRPPSPVKILSSLFGGSSNSFSNTGSLRSKDAAPRTPLIGKIPSMEGSSLLRSNSNKSVQSVQDNDGRVNARSADDRAANPLIRLEKTFTAYVATLLSRKGNIVGKLLRSRGAADELSINAIYNSFIENPYDTQIGSEVTVDIIFVAFEKFLRIAWKDQMGQVMSLHTLEALQDRAQKLFPGDFVDYVKMVLGEMAPQNRRAFIAVVKLLADLLEGCGNDGDRGALTVAFAELLVLDGQPHDYINLLDRMVEDAERLFDDFGPGAITFTSETYSTNGSVSGKRSNHSATGSVASNASSLRKRFADTLLRSNSNKTDTETRPSLWRTMSKNSRSAASGDVMNNSSLSKGALNRSRSIESPNRRPISRDRPTVLGAFDDRPTSSRGQSPSRLSTIGASPEPDGKASSKLQKKKRRSSLSDLKSLMASASLVESYPVDPPIAHPVYNSSPRTPSPTKIPIAGNSLSSDRAPTHRMGTPNQKENVPLGSTRPVGKLTERPHNVMSPADTVIVKDLWSSPKFQSKSVSAASGIPVLRAARERAPSNPQAPNSPPKSPQKLRLQSPQKLRERLQNEAKAISEAEASFQLELAKIGEEMAKLTSGADVQPQETAHLFASVASLESRIPKIINDMTVRNDAIKIDLEKSLQASELKVKELDQLYKESTAENELLYERFNGELAKIVKALKGKGKEDKEELVSKMKTSGEETARVKKENARLRREILTLRTLLKGNE